MEEIEAAQTFSLLGQSQTLLGVILIALIPVGLVGVIRTYLFDRRGYYTHPQILGHVFGIFIYSVIITVIWQYTGKIAYLGNGFLTDTKWTAFLIILFALFNGIILPYAIPYRKAYCIFKKALKSYHPGR